MQYVALMLQMDSPESVAEITNSHPIKAGCSKSFSTCTLLGDNSLGVCHVSAHILSTALVAYCSELSIQDCLYSK